MKGGKKGQMCGLGEQSLPWVWPAVEGPRFYRFRLGLTVKGEPGASQV